MLHHHVVEVSMESTSVYWIPIWRVLSPHFKLNLANPSSLIARVTWRMRSGLPSVRWRSLYAAASYLLRQSNSCVSTTAVYSTSTRRYKKAVKTWCRAATLQYTSEQLRFQCWQQKLQSRGESLLTRGHRPRRVGEANTWTHHQPPRHRCHHSITQRCGKPCRDWHDITIAWWTWHGGGTQGEMPSQNAWDLRKGIPEELKRLQIIPGIKERAATSLIAEIGTDMNKFETDNHLASWSGLKPRNDESNKKIKSRSITHGNVYLCKTIIECAWAISRTKDCFFSRFSYHQTQVRKKNKMKVLVAVARKMLIAVWHVLHDNTNYIDFTTDRKTSQTRGWTRYTDRQQAITFVMVTPRLQINHTDGRLWKPVWVQTRRGKYNYMSRSLFALGPESSCASF